MSKAPFAGNPQVPAGNPFDAKGRNSAWLQSVQQATGLDPRQARPAGAATLVLDISGSMAGPPLREAVEGAISFNHECVRARRSVGLVLFASSVVQVHPPARGGIADQLKTEVTCHGSTNMAAGIAAAAQTLAGVNGSRTIVLATDGHADDAEAALRAANDAKAQGIRIITIATSDADLSLLARMASPKDQVVIQPGQLGRAIAQSAQLLLK